MTVVETLLNCVEPVGALRLRNRLHSFAI